MIDGVVGVITDAGLGGRQEAELGFHGGAVAVEIAFQFLDADLLAVPNDELLGMGDRVLLTMVGGDVAYVADHPLVAGMER